MRKRCTYVLLVGLWIVPAAGTVSAGDYLYDLVPLVSHRDDSSRAWALNDAQVVVGEMEVEGGGIEGFVWTTNTGVVRLGTLGGANSRALDVNNLGMVVGESSTSNGVIRAFVWTADRGMQPLAVSEMTRYSSAFSVNDQGDIVGALEDHRGMHAVCWKDGAIIVLPRLPGEGNVQPLDINEHGDVVGQIQTGSEEEVAGRAFYFPGAAAAKNLRDFRLLSTVGGSAAVAVNNRSVAVGYTMLDSARVQAFRCHRANSLFLLNDQNAMYSAARDVNDRGDVVGSCIPSYFADETACAWLDNRWYDLNEVTDTDSNWWLVQATGINQSGVMAGYGLHGEREQAYLLLPRAGVAAKDWPEVNMQLRVLDNEGHKDQALILSTDVPGEIDVRRVLFYQNGVVVGSVEDPPYEWGWQGHPEGEISFYSEVIEVQGRRFRSPRRWLPEK